MSEFKECPNCGEYGFTDTHKCKPKWEAICIGWNDDDPDKSFGYDSEEAAEKYMERNFYNWEYSEEEEIWIRKNEECEWEKFIVTVETRPHFTARKKEKE